MNTLTEDKTSLTEKLKVEALRCMINTWELIKLKGSKSQRRPLLKQMTVHSLGKAFHQPYIYQKVDLQNILQTQETREQTST